MSELFNFAAGLVRAQAEVLLGERAEERELHRFGRKLLVGTPGVEDALRRSLDEDVHDDEEDEARRLTDLGYFP